MNQASNCACVATRVLVERPGPRCQRLPSRLPPGAPVLAQPSRRAPPSALRAKESKRGPGTTQATVAVPDARLTQVLDVTEQVTGGEDELVQYLGSRHHHDILPEVTVGMSSDRPARVGMPGPPSVDVSSVVEHRQWPGGLLASLLLIAAPSKARSLWNSS